MNKTNEYYWHSPSEYFNHYFYRKRIEEAKEPFKLEILESILSKDSSSTISIYHIGKEWWDLCAGPHVESTGKLPSNAIEVQNIAGAYWRGDETKPMLQVNFLYKMMTCHLNNLLLLESVWNSMGE